MASPTSPSNTQLRSYQQFSSTCSSCPLAQAHYPSPDALQESHLCQKKSSAVTCPKMHPLACSPVPLKVLESLVLSENGSFTSRPSDPYKFADKAKRNTLDAVSCLTHTINAHLDKGSKAFKAVFLDFSNAFNTLSRQGLLDKFAATNPPHGLMKWVHNYYAMSYERQGHTPPPEAVSSCFPRRLPHIGPLSSRHYRDSWSTETQS